MRISSALPLLPALLLMATGCSADSPDAHVAIADQADRVAVLLEEDRSCEAAEALRALEDLAGDSATSEDVRAAVTSFVGSARSSVTCTSPSPEPAPEAPAPPPDPADDPGRGNEGEGRGNGDEGREGDKDDEKDEGGKDKDEGDDGKGEGGKDERGDDD